MLRDGEGKKSSPHLHLPLTSAQHNQAFYQGSFREQDQPGCVPSLLLLQLTTFHESRCSSPGLLLRSNQFISNWKPKVIDVAGPARHQTDHICGHVSKLKAAQSG